MINCCIFSGVGVHRPPKLFPATIRWNRMYVRSMSYLIFGEHRSYKQYYSYTTPPPKFTSCVPSSRSSADRSPAWVSAFFLCALNWSHPLRWARYRLWCCVFFPFIVRNVLTFFCFLRLFHVIRLSPLIFFSNSDVVSWLASSLFLRVNCFLRIIKFRPDFRRTWSGCYRLFQSVVKRLLLCRHTHNFRSSITIIYGVYFLTYRTAKSHTHSYNKQHLS